MPSLTGVLETSLYVDDLDRASCFYEVTFGLTCIEGDDRFRAYSVGGRSVLLLFKRGASNKVTELAQGKLGPHDGSGPLHLAFSISAEELPAWEKLLFERGLRLRPVSSGREAGQAFIFATRTSIPLSWPRQAFGRFISPFPFTDSGVRRAMALRAPWSGLHGNKGSGRAQQPPPCLRR